MLYFALAFLIGNTGLLIFKALPSLLWLILFLFIGLLGLAVAPKSLQRWLSLLTAFLLGLISSIFAAHQVLKNNLPIEFINQSVILNGVIDSIPESKDTQVSFIVRVKQINNNNNIFTKPIRIRLSWYFPPRVLRVGEEWQLSVRLKKPANSFNTGGFDYQKWLFEQRIIATGYVQAGKNNHLLVNHYHIKSIDRIREYIAYGIQKSLTGQPLEGLIEALAVGVRSNITEAQWDILRGTGTNHLFAIAGLHIGFVSGFIYFLVGFVWRQLGRLPLYIPTPVIAVLAALLSAILYSALAGFSLPTQRAVIMTTVFLLATLSRRKIPLWHSWSLALILVLVYDPLAILSASFWMSFSAVALIIYGISGRLHQRNIWRHWLYPQWVIAIGLIPISLLFFQQSSLANFAANAIAIPWVGLLVLPLSLLGGIGWVIWPPLGTLILICAEKLLAIIWPLLTAINQFTWLQWYTVIAQPWVFITAIIAVILILAPRGIPGRWLGILWAFPLILWQPAKPKSGEVWFSVLNIGAGMAVVIRTHDQVLVYESSIKPAINKSTVLPYLQQFGIKQIDSLIINLTTNSNDNILSLLNLIPVKEISLNMANNVVNGNVALCSSNNVWKIDDINFMITALSSNHNKNTICALIVKDLYTTTVITDGTKFNNSYSIPAVKTNLLITAYKDNNAALIKFIELLYPDMLILSSQQNPDVIQLLSNTKIYSNAKQGMLTIKSANALLTPEIDYQKGEKHIWN